MEEGTPDASVIRLWRESAPNPDLRDLDDVTRFNESIEERTLSFDQFPLRRNSGSSGRKPSWLQRSMSRE